MQKKISNEDPISVPLIRFPFFFTHFRPSSRDIAALDGPRALIIGQNSVGPARVIWHTTPEKPALKPRLLSA